MEEGEVKKKRKVGVTSKPLVRKPMTAKTRDEINKMSLSITALISESSSENIGNMVEVVGMNDWEEDSIYFTISQTFSLATTLTIIK